MIGLIMHFQFCFETVLPTKYIRKNERRHNGSIAFHNVLGCMYIQLAPGNFFIGYGTAVRTVARGAVAYLAKIIPKRHIMPFQVLVHHRYYANREVACNTTTNLEKSDALAAAILPVPIR